MKEDLIRKLYDRGQLLEHHVMGAAVYVKLVNAGYSSESLKLERVDASAKAMVPGLSKRSLARLPKATSDYLYAILIKEESLIAMGMKAGQRSRTRAYRTAIEDLQTHLTMAYNRLC